MLQLRLSSESTNDWIFGKKYVIDLGFSGFYKAKEKCFSGGFCPLAFRQSYALGWLLGWLSHKTST